MKPLNDTNMITLIFRLTFIVVMVNFLFGFVHEDEGNLVFTLMLWAVAEAISKFLNRYNGD